MEGLAYMHSHNKVNSHNVHQYASVPHLSPRQQYSPRITSVLYPQSRASSVNSNYSNEMYTPLPRADIKPYHESYFSDVKPPPPLEPEPRNNFIAEGLAASLQARVLAPPIKEEVEMYERRQSYPMNILPQHEHPNNPVKAETAELAYKRESPIIHGPIKANPKRPADAPRDNFNEISQDPHSNSSTPLVDEVREQPRPPQRNEDGEYRFFVTLACVKVFH